MGVPLPFNVFHVRCSTSGDLGDIAGAIGDALGGTTGGDMFACVGSTYHFSSVQVTPLDGSTAAQDEPTGILVGGSGTGDLIPNQAGVVSFKTVQRGSRGRGRMYCGPVTEGQWNGGQMASATQTAMLSGWGAFITDLQSGSPAMQMVVASYVHADAHDVTSHRIDTLAGSMRRRLDQLR